LAISSRHTPDSAELRGLLLQENLEAILFTVMESKGFGAEYTKRYKMVNQFHQERRPLIIVVCGAPCTGTMLLEMLCTLVEHHVACRCGVK